MVKFCPHCGSYVPVGQEDCQRCPASSGGFAPELKQVNPAELTLKDVLESFPSKTLRPYQEEAIRSIVEAFTSGKRCVILAAPTGFGKSYLNAAFTSLTRSFYATPQLALIDQILRDPLLKGRFVEIRGRQNYRCYYQPRRSVQVGKCETEEYACGERFNVCPYWIQKMKAVNSSRVLTSLAYLISEGQSEGVSESYLGSRTLLVLDESHDLEEQCLDHISVRVTPYTIPHDLYQQILPELRELRTDSQLEGFLETVDALLRNMLDRMNGQVGSSGLSIQQADEKKAVERYLENYRLYNSSQTEWVWQIRNDCLLIQPIFAKEFMKQLIWKRATHYIISSATILNSEEYVELTGLGTILDEDEISVLKVPSTFPPENRPVVDATVGPLSRREWDANMPKAVLAVEEILQKESGNVAIHCHAYSHQRYLAENIEESFKPRLIVHSSRDREEKLREWMHSRGKVFVSVAFNEGQDWKYDLCDSQVLLKVPYPDLGDKRIRRRLTLGYQGWYERQALADVIQAYGRAIRAEDDKARFYVVDGSFHRLVRNCWSTIPEWFKEVLPESFRNDKQEDVTDVSL